MKHRPNIRTAGVGLCRRELPPLVLYFLQKSSDFNRKSSVFNQKSSNFNRKSSVFNQKSSVFNRRSSVFNRKSSFFQSHGFLTWILTSCMLSGISSTITCQVIVFRQQVIVFHQQVIVFHHKTIIFQWKINRKASFL